MGRRSVRVELGPKREGLGLHRELGLLLGVGLVTRALFLGPGLKVGLGFHLGFGLGLGLLLGVGLVTRALSSDVFPTFGWPTKPTWLGLGLGLGLELELGQGLGLGLELELGQGLGVGLELELGLGLGLGLG